MEAILHRFNKASHGFSLMNRMTVYKQKDRPRTSMKETLDELGRSRGHPRRPPTPPDMRFSIRRFMKRTGDVILSPLSSASGASCPPQRRSEPRRGSAPSPLCRSFLTGSLLLSWALHVIPVPTCGVSCSALRLTPNMASADFRQSIPRPLDRGSTNRQNAGPPRV